MKILIVHNQYLDAGGEDAVVESEKKMLEAYGHEVVYYKRSNQEILAYSSLKRCTVLKDISSSSHSYREIRDLIKKYNLEIAHVHNIFLLISPSVYYACKREGIPVVQSLHNYRLLCANGTLFRNGHICQKCLGQSSWPSVFYGCWRQSRFMTAALVKALVVQRKSTRMINRFIALSSFSRDKFIEGGLPPKKIMVKPNFIDFDPGHRTSIGKYALFIGTLRHYKGIFTLLSAWQDINKMSLKVVGNGPLYNDVIKKYRRNHNVEFLGNIPLSDMIDLIKGSCFMVVPSECFENFPRVIIESFACGVPVLASDIGAMQELVKDGINGLLFECGNAVDLGEKAKRLFNNESLNTMLGANARKIYEEKYTMENNYRALMKIYEEAISDYN